MMLLMPTMTVVDVTKSSKPSRSPEKRNKKTRLKREIGVVVVVVLGNDDTPKSNGQQLSWCRASVRGLGYPGQGHTTLLRACEADATRFRTHEPTKRFTQMCQPPS